MLVGKRLGGKAVAQSGALRPPLRALRPQRAGAASRDFCWYADFAFLPINFHVECMIRVPRS